VQINAKTGYERKVVRIAEILENNDDDTKKKKQTETQSRTIGGNNFSGSPLADDNDIVDGGGLAAEGGDSEPPPFPSELAQAAEPLLLMKEGQLVQIQKQREDGWAYGLVIFDPHAATSAAAVVNKENKAAGGNRSEVGRRSGGGGIELAHKRSPQQQPTIFGGGGQSSAAANPFDLSCQLVQQQQQGSRSRDESADRPPNSKAQSSVHAQDGDEDNGESGGSATAGWFPSSFTGPPGVEEMSALQVSNAVVSHSMHVTHTHTKVKQGGGDVAWVSCVLCFFRTFWLAQGETRRMRWRRPRPGPATPTR
jgi:hypothetical protein